MERKVGVLLLSQCREARAWDHNQYLEALGSHAPTSLQPKGVCCPMTKSGVLEAEQAMGHGKQEKPHPGLFWNVGGRAGLRKKRDSEIT